MRLLYGILLFGFNFILWVAAPFNRKARLWINGRRGQLKQLARDIKKGDRVIWFHCASLGEFEQGRPVMEAIRKNFTSYKILLTFFSPSGYEIRKDTTVADWVYYLPLDSQVNARKFVALVNPVMAVFVKYEYWFNFIHELSLNKIPTLVVSAIFRPSQYIFKPWGYWAMQHLQKITYFFVQDEASLQLLNRAKIYHAEVGGDTRFDRVLKLASENRTLPLIETFRNNGTLLVAGSTWPADEDVLLQCLKKLPDGIKLIIAPHETGHEHVDLIMKKFASFQPVLYSHADQQSVKEAKVLIIDSIGLLAYLYRYAKFAYLGGGFGVGIHNLLEAVTYGIPVVFGPNHQKFIEAVELIERGAGFPVSNAQEAIRQCKILLADNEKYSKSSNAALAYVNEKSGATWQVVDHLKQYLIAD